MSEWLYRLQGWFGAGKAHSQWRVMNLFTERVLEPVFQPMVDLRNGDILGQEALVRTPRKMAETSIKALLDAALQERYLKKFELACLELAIERWIAEYGKGHLYVNFSAQTLVQLHESDSVGSLLQLMQKHHISPRRMALELSGYTRIPDLDVLVAALRPLRDAGVTIALDNFKPSESSMHVWAKVLPHVVKMSPSVSRDIADDVEQRRVVRSMVRLARIHHALLLAKSVENEEELRMMKLLGVDVAQGFFLGSPSTEPVRTLNLRARDVLLAAEDTFETEPSKLDVRYSEPDSRFSLLS